MEKIFIAWSGQNGYNIANEVKKKLDSAEFNVFVGGQGDGVETFVGSQIISEMNSSSSAIVIFAPRHDKKKNENLMFEWGYLVNKFENSCIYGFCTEKNKIELASDVQGTWLEEIQIDSSLMDELKENENYSNKQVDDISTKLVEEFKKLYYVRQNMNNSSVTNIEIFSKYFEFKKIIEGHISNPHYSNSKMAHIILISLYSSYFHDDLQEFQICLRKLYESTKIESFKNVILSAIFSAKLFCDTDMLSKELNTNLYSTIVEVFLSSLNYVNSQLKKSKKTNTVNTKMMYLWKILLLDRLALCDSLYKGKYEQEHYEYLKSAIDYYKKELDEIDNLNKSCNSSDLYLLFIKALVTRSLAMCYKEIDDGDKYNLKMKETISIRNEVIHSYNCYSESVRNKRIENRLIQESNLVELEYKKNLLNQKGEPNYKFYAISDYIKDEFDKQIKANSLFEMLVNAEKAFVKNNSYKMLVCDLDDTLLNDDLMVPQSTIDAIKRMKQNNKKFVVASGRTIESTEKYHKLLNFDNPAILYHGALVYDFSSKTIVKRTPIDTLTACDILKKFEECGYWINVYTEDTIYVVKQSEYTISYKNRCGGEFVETGRPLHEYVFERNICPLKIEIETSPPLVNSIVDNVMIDFAHKVNCFVSKNWIVEIINQNADKSYAIKSIANSCNVGKDEIVCVGDSKSDIPLYKYCAKKIAMNNAVDELKQLADEVTVSNNNNEGVLSIINKYFSI